MSSIPISLRDQLIEQLREIEQKTESIFMVLAESLPSLVTEMKESLNQSQSALACMDQSSDEGCRDGIELSAVVGAIRSEMERGAARFQAMSERDTQLFGRLQNGITQLEEIAEAIDAIREDSEDMELVSLNAMTVALKAGNAGRAFSYITEELKRLANRTITLSESISERGTRLIENFRELERTLNDAREFQESLVGNLQSRIAGGLDELETAVHGTVSELSALREESAELQQPVNGMMEAIQLQDLIRQSIDHIILSLQAIKPEDELTTDTALLDELAFTRQIPGLASRLIDDVAGQIDGSVETFLSLTEEAEAKLNRLQTEQKTFLAENIDTGMSDSETLDAHFHRASEMLQTFLNDLEDNLKKKEHLVQRSGSITTEVQDLDAQFQSFTTLVNRFHSIDVASRIEVAKQEVLRRMGTSAEQMTTLTRTIENDVNRSLEATQEFIKTTSSVIENHHSHFQEESHFVGEFGSSIRSRYEALSATREAVVQAVGGFSLFTDGFVRVFATSKNNGKQLSELGVEIRDLKGVLDDMQQAIDQRYNEELSTQGLESWSIENDRLREIIERFTIFTHKQQAGDLVGFDVEDGVGAGDVTLF